MEQARRDVGTNFGQLFTPPEYQKLRQRLVRLFARRGSRSPEELADETIARVVKRIPEVSPTYVGDPIRYVYAVARNVYLESTRQPTIFPLADGMEPERPLWEAQHDEDALASLELCLEALTKSERGLVLEYHGHGKRARQARARMAKRLELSESGLRLRVHRIRQRIYACVMERLKKS